MTAAAKQRRPRGRPSSGLSARLPGVTCTPEMLAAIQDAAERDCVGVGEWIREACARMLAEMGADDEG